MTTFSKWFEVMGYRHGQTREAAEAIGFAGSSGTRLNTGSLATDKTTLLAMSAARAGLQPWDPRNDFEAVAARATIDAIRNAKGGAA